jgi:hypothetical protein
MNTPVGPLPVTFRVGLIGPRLWRGGGQLTIAPGSLLCSPGRLMAGVSKAHQVRYEGSRVEIYVARLVPPWFDLTIPIRGEGGTLVATIWLLARRKVRQALREAGFDVVEHITWIDRGFRWAEMKKSGSSPNPPNTAT